MKPEKSRALNNTYKHIYLMFLSRDIDNYNRRKSKILRLLWDIVVFRLVAYLLKMIFLMLQLLYKIGYIYIRFGIILTQFYINFSRQEHQICIVQRLRFSGFILYPLSFFMLRPFRWFI